MTSLGYKLYNFLKLNQTIPQRTIGHGRGTRIISGWDVTQNSGTSIDITSGKGTIYNSATQIEIPVSGNSISNFSVADNIAAGADASYILIDINGNASSITTEPLDGDLRNYIYVSKVSHRSGSAITAIRKIKNYGEEAVINIKELAEAIGALNISGNSITAYGSGLQIQKSAGISYRFHINSDLDRKNPSYPVDAELVPVTFNYCQMKTGGGVIYTPGQTAIDPLHYDTKNSSLGLVGTPYFQNQRLFFFPRTNSIYIFYGRALYNSKDEAKIGYSSEGFTTGSSFFDGSIQLCRIIIKGNCTDLTDTDRAEIIAEGKFSGTSGGAGGGLATVQIYGEMYAYENATAIVIGQANVYHAIAYSGIITGTVNKTTFTAGVVGAIASVSDYSATVAGTVLITVSAGHNLTSGDVVAIHSTTNYNGVYVATVVSPTTFYITKAYVSSQTGTYARGARLKINEGGAGTYKVHFNCTAFTASNAVNIKMEVNKNITALDNIASSRKYSNQNDYGQMTASGFVTVLENDVIWMSVRNETGATNITIRHFNMNLIKIS